MKLPRKMLTAFCQKRKIQELSLFGSALRDDFGPDSDIDLLVRFSPEAEWSLWDKVRMQQELAGLLARKVDLVSKNALEHSTNSVRKQHILNHTKVIYAA
ncbi:MAG: nucleotidyltransferase family protein [Gammaproteobacteria bacterium]|nr:nucleotidyltransferase family protein [Gammaproteobacteria bacterium]